MVRECHHQRERATNGNAASRHVEYSGCITSERPKPLEPLPIVTPKAECGAGVKGTIHVLDPNTLCYGICGAKVVERMPYLRRRDFHRVAEGCVKCRQRMGLESWRSKNRASQ